MGGRTTFHINLVRLFGFCYDAGVRALVYEFMEHGALDSYLFDRSRDVGFQTMRAIAVGVAGATRSASRRLCTTTSSPATSSSTAASRPKWPTSASRSC